MSALRLCGALGVAVSLAACSNERPPHSCTMPDSVFDDWAKSVTKAPGAYEGYSVSAVTSGLTVTVTGTGARHFGERTECSPMERWLADGGAPTFADQDDRCNFEGRLFATLAAAGFQDFAPLNEAHEHRGFENGALRVADWADMDRAIDIVGGELQKSGLGESLTLGAFYQCR